MPTYKFTCPGCKLTEERSTHDNRSFIGIICPSCNEVFNVREITEKESQDEDDARRYLEELKRDPKEEYYQ